MLLTPPPRARFGGAHAGGDTAALSREQLEAEVAKLRSAGIRVFPYTNGRLYDPSLPEWSAEGAISASCGCFRAFQ